MSEQLKSRLKHELQRVRQELNETLENSDKVNRNDFHPFISRSFLKQTFSGHSVRRAVQFYLKSKNKHLPEHGRKIGGQRYQESQKNDANGRHNRALDSVNAKFERDLTTKIQDDALKLFAVLILLDKGDLIIPLLNAEVNDRVFESPVENLEQTLLQVQEMYPIAREICNEQWKFPLQLLSDRHYSFPSDKFIPPFLKPAYVGGGSYGHIVKVTIPAEQLEGCRKAADFVYKKVRKREDQTWPLLLREVESLRARVHRHVIPLVASFDCYIRESSWDTSWVYMILPYAAGGDMEEWINSSSTPFPPSASQEDHRENLYETIYSVASGLAYIHREFDGMITCHHDLKPKNIVLESNTWKICDFGKSHLKSVREGSGTEGAPIGTEEYRPPEYYDESGHRATTMHGRPFDVFSMGCITLQLATLIVFGWNGEVKDFKHKREQPSAKKRFPAMREPQGSAFHNNLELVDARIIELEERDPGERITKVLRLTREMLEKSPDKRLFAWEVEADLYEFLHPNATKAALQELYKGVIAKPRHSADRDYHDPFKRAKSQGKRILADSMKDQGYSDSFLPVLSQALGGKSDQQRDSQSNLPANFGRRELFGRQRIMNQIASGFETTNRVGLFGYGGNGKSHIAFQYTTQLGPIRGKNNSVPWADQKHKHTFWVHAGTTPSFQKSFSEIAEKINLPLVDTSPDDVRLGVKKWLEDRKNGDWILVLDGLDSKYDSDRLNGYLPSLPSGQILVTSRDRDALLVVNDLEESQCINVGNLNHEDSRRLLLSGISHLTKEDEHFVDPLLRQLPSPVLIRLAMKELKEHELEGSSVKQLHERLCADKMGMLAEWQIFGRFLKHVRDPSGQSPQEKKAINLLGSLACLCKDSLETEIIELKYPPEERHEAKEYIKILVNHSYIDANGPTYVMNEMIQQCTIQWIIRNEGHEVAIRYYDEMLCIIYNAYGSKKLRHGNQQKGTPKSYFQKVKYMAHFEEFLTYVKSLGSEAVETFRLNAAAARSIVTFCRVYTEDNRWSDAIRLLEFSWRCDIRQRKGVEDPRPEILLELAKTLRLRPSGKDTPSHLRKALKYLNKGLTDAKNLGPRQNWRLMLERSAVLSDLEKPDEARKRLDELEKKISTELDMQKVVIRIAEQRARIDFREGKRKKKKSLVIKARKGWKAVEGHVQELRPKDEQWMTDVQAELARVDLEIPTKKALDEAESIYLRQQKKLKETYDRRPDHDHLRIAERNLAAVWMRRGEPAKAEKCLRQHLTHYINKYGRDDGETRLFAYLLRDAMYLQGNSDGVASLSKEFEMKGLKGGSGIGHWWSQPDPDSDPSWEFESGRS